MELLNCLSRYDHDDVRDDYDMVCSNLLEKETDVEKEPDVAYLGAHDKASSPSRLRIVEVL